MNRSWVRYMARRLLSVVAMGVAAAGVAAPSGPVDATARAEIAARRQQVDARYAASQRDCAERFAVMTCLEAARGERRRALSDLASRQAALDDAERQRRAAARHERIEGKQLHRAADERERASAPLLPIETTPLLIRRRPEPAGAVPSSVPPVPLKRSAAELRLREQRAREATEARLQAARQRQDASARREAARRQSGKPAAKALPSVGAASAP